VGWASIPCPKINALKGRQVAAHVTKLLPVFVCHEKGAYVWACMAADYTYGRPCPSLSRAHRFPNRQTHTITHRQLWERLCEFFNPILVLAGPELKQALGVLLSIGVILVLHSATMAFRRQATPE
jgi:hypothetical protein